METIEPSNEANSPEIIQPQPIAKPDLRDSNLNYKPKTIFYKYGLVCILIFVFVISIVFWIHSPSAVSPWKTYKNNELGFSLSYPGYLKVEEKDYPGEEYIAFVPPGKDESVFRVSVHNDFHPLKAYENELTVTHDLIEEKDVTVDGIIGKLIVTSYVLAKDKSRTDYSKVIVSNDETFQFGGFSKDLDNPDNAVFGKILSTVKFDRKGINQFEELPDITKWTTYTNPISHYTLQYPPEWSVEETTVPKQISQTKRLSYTSFKDDDYIYDLRVEAFPLSSISELEKGNDIEQCSNYRTNNLTLTSGKQINFAKCQYANKLILQYPEKDLLFVVRSKRGVLNPPVIDSFLSSIIPQ